MNTSQLSRRAFLTATALVATSGPTAARAAEHRPVPGAAPIPATARVRQGGVDFAVAVRSVQDVAVLTYTISNIGSASDTFTVSYTDQMNSRKSKTRSVALGSGKTKNVTVYGRLDHSFMVQVCQLDGTCTSVGPVGHIRPKPSVGATP